jgi:Fe-S-cluster-containing dehydrogenase component
MTCVLACKQEHLTGPGVSWIKVLEIEDRDANTINHSPITCMHCEDAPCINACDNFAISKRDDGIVIIDQEKCQGTGSCIDACPYGVISMNPASGYFQTPQPYEEAPKDFRNQRPGKASKCTLCSHRIEQGKIPICVEACRSEVMTFGDLDDPHSEISKILKTSKDLLADKNQEPKVTYLATDKIIKKIEDQLPE